MLRYYPSDVVKEKSVTLECIVQTPGNPDNLTYIWIRGVHVIPEVTVSNFTISPVRLETRSNFTCIAVNEGGRSEPATVFINVNGKYIANSFVSNIIVCTYTECLEMNYQLY